MCNKSIELGVFFKPNSVWKFDFELGTEKCHVNTDTTLSQQSNQIYLLQTNKNWGHFHIHPLSSEKENTKNLDAHCSKK